MTTFTESLPASESLRKRDGFLTRIADPTFNVLTVGILVLVAVSIIYPLYFIVIASVSDPNLIAQGKVWLFPRGFTLEGYETLFRNDAMLRGFANSLLYTFVGTAISVAVILCAGCALSRKDMPGRSSVSVSSSSTE